MTRTIVVFILCTSFAHVLSGQVIVNINITNLENNSGQIVLNFTDGDNKQVKALYGKIADKKCILTISDLKPGKYAFKYFHDENSNKKLDANLIGIPKEGYGFSNNTYGSFGPPDFKDTIFEVKNDTTIICIVKYINF